MITRSIIITEASLTGVCLFPEEAVQDLVVPCTGPVPGLPSDTFPPETVLLEHPARGPVLGKDVRSHPVEIEHVEREAQYKRHRLGRNALPPVPFPQPIAELGGPLLFGVSSYLTTVLTAQTSAGANVPDEVTSSMPIAPMGKITIDENFVVMFAVACLTLSSVFGSLIIGLLKEDNELAGVKYIPPLLCVALSLFFGVRHFIFTYFGDMLM